ncbi:MAG: ribonuclease III [Gammaproteobacteria bacterium]|nr:ribonuclease III [Gammaproteobacteria bacterium]
MADIAKLSRTLQYSFQNSALLTQALTHRSVGSNNNERLEFLGDSILNFVIAAQLFQQFPRESEGVLSRLRSSLVKGETLALLAKDLELGEYLSLGQGEMKSGGFRRQSILADAFEAIIGAVYLDGGFEEAKALLLRLFAERLKTISPNVTIKDPKTRLQEYLQGRKKPLPVYALVSLEGEAHEQQFIISCQIEGLEQVTEGRGSSRRKAEQTAAQVFLEILGQ